MSGGWSRFERGGSMGGGNPDTPWWRYAQFVLLLWSAAAILVSPVLLLVYLTVGF